MVLLTVLVLLWASPPLTSAGRLRSFYLKHTNTSINISEARDLCLQSNYTDIVTVYDKQDNDELVQLMLRENVTRAWIGAYTGPQWSDGAEVTFNKLTCSDFDWCAAMRANEDWECILCSNGRNFTCYDAGDGESSYNYTLILQNKTWTEAQEYCREKHTDLVSIRNEVENKLVYNAALSYDRPLNNPFWIGLRYIKSNQLSWLDGGQSKYSDFTNEPNTKFTYLNVNGSWTKSNTSEYASALCYESFIHVSKDKMSWEKALDYCNDSGLLCIESEKDQIDTDRELQRQKISGPVWIGLRQSRLFGFWIWVNGLQVGPWTNWKEGRQPEHQKSNYCGAMEKVNRTFKWSDKDCRSKFRVLCEMR